MFNNDFVLYGEQFVKVSKCAISMAWYNFNPFILVFLNYFLFKCLSTIICVFVCVCLCVLVYVCVCVCVCLYSLSTVPASVTRWASVTGCSVICSQDARWGEPR